MADVHTEGLEYIMAVAIAQTQTAPANFYLGWCTDAAIDENASLSDLTELAASNGYARVAIASNGTDWTSAAYNADGRKVTSKTCTFTAAGGDWTKAESWFLATTSDDSGKLIASGALNSGSGVTLLDTKNYDVAAEIRLVITNGWTVEGLQYLLECAFTETQTPPTDFYRGLGTNTSLADSATLASITEVTGTGYARQAIPSDATDWTGTGTGTDDFQFTSEEDTFMATDADWDEAMIDFIATTVDGTGKLLCWRPVNEGSGYDLGDDEAYDSRTMLLLTG